MEDDRLGERGLSPPQNRVAGTIAEFAQEVSSEGRGQILFLSGQLGSGRSHLLRVAADRLAEMPGELRVARGGLTRAPDSHETSKWAESAEALFTSAASVASALDPGLSLVGPVAALSVAAAGIVQTATRGVTSTELVTRVLRAASREDPKRALICLVDDATWLSGTWWTELQFFFAKEIADELPLLLVLAIDGDPHAAGPSDDGPPGSVAQSLLRRNLASWTSLGELTEDELSSWLGPAPREAARATLELTRGRSGEAVELWRGWLADGVLVPSTGEGWELQRPDGILDDAAGKLAEMIETALGPREGDDRDVLREALGFAALEGKTFTAAAVAEAVRGDRDEVEDLLDELVVEPPGEGVLRPPRAVEIQNLQHSRSWALWRYEFANSLIWRAARDRFSDLPTERAAEQLLEALAASYEHETPRIAPLMARLAKLTGNPSTSTRYEGLVRVPSQAALVGQARCLLIADSSDWTTTEHRDASYALSQVALKLCFFKPYATIQPFAAQAVEHAKKAGAQGRRAHALAKLAEGRLLHRLGDLDGAAEAFTDARRTSRDGDPGLLASILSELVDVLRTRENEQHDEERRLLEEAAALYERVGSSRGRAACRYSLGIIAIHEGNLPLGRSLNEEALTMFRAAREREWEMTCFYQQAEIEYRDGKPDLAWDFVQEALRYQSAIGKTYSEAACLGLLARIECTRGDTESARAAAESALALSWKLEDLPGLASTLRISAEVAANRGENGRARQFLLEAREVYEEIGSEHRILRISRQLDDLPPNTQ